MSIFRSQTPKRRIIIKSVSDHTEHRADLIVDYQGRCGYCNDKDTWRFAWFEIDHFVPQKYLKTISKTEYSNLVYACRSCNNAKRAHWPTGDEKVYNQNDEGFIDPCDNEYNEQFTRLGNGRIVPKTNLGQWMYNKLKFYKPQHEIIWNIEQLDLLIEECEKILEEMENNALKEKLLSLYREYRNYTRQLGTIG